MEIDQIGKIVAGWAAIQPVIKKIWLFGSRVRGTGREKSDIDIAIEIEKFEGDSDTWTTFVFERDELKESLQLLLPLAVDLQWYGGPQETPRIHSALQESSILVYEAT